MYDLDDLYLLLDEIRNELVKVNDKLENLEKLDQLDDIKADMEDVKDELDSIHLTML